MRSQAVNFSGSVHRRASQPPPSERIELGETTVTRIQPRASSRGSGSAMKIWPAFITDPADGESGRAGHIRGQPFAHPGDVLAQHIQLIGD